MPLFWCIVVAVSVMAIGICTALLIISASNKAEEKPAAESLPIRKLKVSDDDLEIFCKLFDAALYSEHHKNEAELMFWRFVFSILPETKKGNWRVVSVSAIQKELHEIK
jgi:hypothetical protein